MKQTDKQTDKRIDNKQRLGVTRSAEELTDITTRGGELGICIIPLPLFRYAPVEFSLTPKELAAIDWLCFTSARGVECFFQGLKEQGVSVSAETKFAVVGAKTASSLVALGFSVSIQPHTTISEALFEELLNTLAGVSEVRCNLVYVGAEVVRFDPVSLFADTSVDYRRVVVYRAEPEIPPQESALGFSQDDSILFTSPKTAERFEELFGAPKARVVAIGEITAEAIEDIGWGAPEVLTEPDLEMALKHVLGNRQQEKETCNG